MDIAKWPETRGRKRIFNFSDFNVGDILEFTASGKYIHRGKMRPSYPHTIYLSAMAWSKTRGLNWKLSRRTDGLSVYLKRIS